MDGRTDTHKHTVMHTASMHAPLLIPAFHLLAQKDASLLTYLFCLLAGCVAGWLVYLLTCLLTYKQTSKQTDKRENVYTYVHTYIFRQKTCIHTPMCAYHLVACLPSRLLTSA